MRDGINLLNIFTQSDNIYIKLAASELLNVANSNYDIAIYAWEEVVASLYNDGRYLVVIKALSDLPKYGSYISFFIIGTDFLSNVSETSLYAEYTVANANISNSLCEEIKEIANSGEQLEYGISINNNYKTAARRFTDLIVLRKNAEEQYIKLNESLPFYTAWAEEDCLEYAKNNIITLNEILSKYAYLI